MTAIWLRNLMAMGIQSGVLILAGAALARAFRIQTPRASLAYWRTLLVVCVALPFCQPWRIVPVASFETAAISAAAASDVSGVAVGIQPGPALSWPSTGTLVLFVVVAGILARALWLVLGVRALRRIRREASPIDPLPDTIKLAQDRVGVRAGMFISTRIAGPITFGVIRPVIVFPPSVTGMAEPIQHAIACHELIHVRRRDWLFEVLRRPYPCVRVLSARPAEEAGRAHLPGEHHDDTSRNPVARRQRPRARGHDRRALVSTRSAGPACGG